MKTTTSLTVAILMAAVSSSVWAGDSDVSRVDIGKSRNLQQTSTSDPVDQTNPFRFSASVQDSQPSQSVITSAAFTPPGGSSTSMTGDGQGNFSLEQSFASQGALNLAFPDGSYSFDIQTFNPPTAYNPTISLGGSFANSPKILNTNFNSGALEFDSTQDFTFNWNSFTGFTNGTSEIVFHVENTPVNQFFFSPTTSTTLSGGTLQPNQTYSAYVTFFKDFQGVTDGTTQLSSLYGVETDFTIQTTPEPSSALLACFGGVAMLAVTKFRRVVRTNS